MLGHYSLAEAPIAALAGLNVAVDVTGVAGTTSLGSESVATDQVLDVTGVAGTGVVPSVILWGEEGVGGDLPSATWIKIAA